MIKLKDLLNEGVFDKGILKAVFLAGGPGSGKSTYSEYLIRHFGIKHIYPGGMLRKEIEEKRVNSKRKREREEDRIWSKKDLSNPGSTCF